MLAALKAHFLSFDTVLIAASHQSLMELEIGIRSLDMREEKIVPMQGPASRLQLHMKSDVAILSSLDCWMLEFVLN
jgi:hypothetical protein